MAKNFFRKIFFELDRASANRAGQQMEDTLAKAGADGGKNFARELKKEFDRRSAEIKVALRKGLIDEKEAKRLGDEAARGYNRGILRGMDAARARGELTDREFVKLSRSLKNVGDAGSTAFGRIKMSIGDMWSSGMAQLVGAGGIMFGLRRAIDEANILDASARVLAATAKITGVEFSFLAAQAEAANDRFRLGTVLSNNLTIELSKLTAKAGDVTQLAAGMEAFLDIGAARGLTAQQTLDAVRQSILGIDEGTDKLFGKNPSALYKEYADRIGESAAALTDQQKAIAILDGALRDGEKVRGSYLEWLNTAAGQQFLLTQEVDKTFAALGKSLQPALVAILPAFTLLAKAGSGFIEVLQDLGRYITGTVLFFIGGLADANAFLAESQALALRGAAALADFFGADDTAEKWRDRADAIKGEAQALRDYAAAAREVAGETFREAGAAFGGRTSAGGGGGASTPGGGGTAGGGAGTGADPFARLEGLSPELAGPDPKLIEERMGEVVAISEHAANSLRNDWGNAFNAVEEQAAAMNLSISGMFMTLANGGVGAIASLAKAKVIENIAWAIENAAKALGLISLGQVPNAAAAKAAAVGHTQAAAKWGAVGVIASAGGGGSSGGGASRAIGAGGLSNVGGAAADRSQPAAQVHIYIDPLNPYEPAYQRNIAAVERFAKENYGAMDVQVHPRTGR